MKDRQEEEETLIADFGGLIDAPDEEEEELRQDETPAEFFYLWDTKEKIFDLFCTVSNYLTDNGMLNPTLIETLCDRRNIDFEEALADLPVILDGYMSVLNPPPEKDKNPKKEQLDDR